jgi:hypothetical protein
LIDKRMSEMFEKIRHQTSKPQLAMFVERIYFRIRARVRIAFLQRCHSNIVGLLSQRSIVESYP